MLVQNYLARSPPDISTRPLEMSQEVYPGKALAAYLSMSQDLIRLLHLDSLPYALGLYLKPTVGQPT